MPPRRRSESSRGAPEALPERTASIACIRAGRALRGTREQAAESMFELAVDLALCTGPDGIDRLFNLWEDDLRSLQRARTSSLWRRVSAA